MTFSPYSSPAFIICRCFGDGQSVHGEMIPHCSFHLHFSNNEQCWLSFVCRWLSVCLLWRMSIEIFCPFWLVYLFFRYWVVWAVHIFWKLTPCWLVASFVNIFFHSVDCLSVYGFLCCAKVLSLIRFYLIIFISIIIYKTST